MAPAPRYTPPPRKQRAWVAPLVVLLVMGALAAGVIAVVQMSDDKDSDASGKSGAKAVSSTVPTTTTIPRVTQVDLLKGYCNAPGLKWPEVPAHVPGEPDRTFTNVTDVGVETASNETSGSFYPTDASTLGGSTVISPHTDNQFTDNGWVLPETRTVACVTLLGTENVGQSCDFNNYSQFGSFSNGYKTMQLAQNRFAITVYELHSGGILHKGEILTPASRCSPGAVVTGGDVLAWGLTDADILAWLNSHFVDGKPA